MRMLMNNLDEEVAENLTLGAESTFGPGILDLDRVRDSVRDLSASYGLPVDPDALVRDLPVGTLYPAHGPVIPDGQSKLNEYLVHREHRERLVLEAVNKGAATLREIVPRAYTDTPEFMHPVAERSTQAILIKLVREKRLSRQDDRYVIPPPQDGTTGTAPTRR